MKIKQKQNSEIAKKANLHIAARCDAELSQRIQYWCKENQMSQSQLIVRAVDKYISEEHTLKAIFLTDQEAVQFGDEAIKEHSYTLEKLK